MPRPPRFTIRAASALTGINENTLRAWERRYGLIRPERTAKGYRLYSDEDIARLRVIKRAMHEGVPAGRMRVYLETPEGQARLHDGTAAAATGVPGTNGRLSDCCDRIEEAARRLDRAALERAFHDSVSMHSLRDAFHHALGPALLTLCPHGCGETCEATQRFLTAFARQHLEKALAGLRPLHQQPRALFACAPGETHEVDLMLLTLEVGLEGVSARYLGADAALETLREVAGTAGSRAVVLSATRGMPQEAVLGLRDALTALPRRPRLLMEGRAAQAHRDWLEAIGVETLAATPAEASRQVLRAAAAG